MTIKEKKDLAYLLYTKGMVETQKELAVRVGVSETTMSKWIRDGDWENHRQSILVTKQQQLRIMFEELDGINNYLSGLNKEDGNYFKVAQIRRQLIKDIKSLEGNITKSVIVDVFLQFNRWLQRSDMEKAKEIFEIQDLFIKSIN